MGLTDLSKNPRIRQRAFVKLKIYHMFSLNFFKKSPELALGSLNMWTFSFGFFRLLTVFKRDFMVPNDLWQKSLESVLEPFKICKFSLGFFSVLLILNIFCMISCNMCKKLPRVCVKAIENFHCFLIFWRKTYSSHWCVLKMSRSCIRVIENLQIVS